MNQTSRCRMAMFTIVLGTSLAACGGQEPKLDVQVAKNQPAQPAATQEAAGPSGEPSTAATPAEPPMIASHAPAAAAPGGELPPGHPPVSGNGSAMGAMGLAPVDTQAGTGANALNWAAPKDWVAEPPSSSMRRAQYRVPGPGGDAECAVFYFGPGQGGDTMANAERWASQFAGPDGKPATDTLKTRKLDVGGIQVVLVEAHGTYNAGSMMGGPSHPQPGYALLAAIAEGPDAKWFFKTVGPQATIDAQRSAFEQMMKSLHQGG